jgi:intracellular sulfur oxidation DsrE/DsrF family protein
MIARHSVARLVAAVLVAASLSARAADATAPVAVAVREQAIFAVTDADPAKWNFTLGNIANALDGIGADKADIELVIYGPAIAMLKKDSVVADKLAAALARGVRIAACQNSMRGFKIEAADLVPGAVVVPAGVVELIRREHAGYAYVRS